MRRLWLGLTFVVAAVTAVLHPGAAVSSDALPSYVAPRHAGAILSWLQRHPEYRIALDADCSCADDIASIRSGDGWPPAPDYHPYYVVGDFRGDGAEDVAVGVISRQRAGKFRVLIIHGHSPGGQVVTVFLSKDRQLGEGLFYGPPRPKPWRLIVGAFASEGAAFEPTASGYRLSETDAE